MVEFPTEILYNNTLWLCDYLNMDYQNAKVRKRIVSSIEEWENFVYNNKENPFSYYAKNSGSEGTYIYKR